MALQIYTEKGNASKLILPASAVAKKDDNGTLCSKEPKKAQTLTLSWTEKQQNDTSINLKRFVNVDFLRMENST